MAILNDDIESWREFRRIRNLYNRTVKVKKCNYFHKKKLDIKKILRMIMITVVVEVVKKMWNTVKSLSGKQCIQPPRYCPW